MHDHKHLSITLHRSTLGLGCWHEINILTDSLTFHKISTPEKYTPYSIFIFESNYTLGGSGGSNVRAIIGIVVGVSLFIIVLVMLPIFLIVVIMVTSRRKGRYSGINFVFILICIFLFHNDY